MPNNTANTISGIYARIMPLNRKIHVGNKESDNALSLPLLFQHTAQKIRYATHNAPFTDR